jgi:hypothetical protein
MHGDVAEERDPLAGAELAQHVRVEVFVVVDARAELVREVHVQPGGQRLLALHRIGDEQRCPSGHLDRIAARDLRPARQPSKRGVHGLVHRNDYRVDAARVHQDVEIVKHGPEAEAA